MTADIRPTGPSSSLGVCHNIRVAGRLRLKSLLAAGAPSARHPTRTQLRNPFPPFVNEGSSAAPRRAAADRGDPEPGGEDRAAEGTGGCEEIEAEWRRKHAAWSRAKGQHEASQARERDEFSAAQQRKNSAISEFKRRFESGETDAIDEYCEMVFERSSYPKSRRYCAPSTRSSSLAIRNRYRAPSLTGGRL